MFEKREPAWWKPPDSAHFHRSAGKNRRRRLELVPQPAGEVWLFVENLVGMSPRAGRTVVHRGFANRKGDRQPAIGVLPCDSFDALPIDANRAQPCGGRQDKRNHRPLPIRRLEAEVVQETVWQKLRR